MVLGTAHPAKFADAVTDALGQSPALPAALARLTDLPEKMTIAVPMRPRYFIVFALICMTAGLIGTATGYFAVEALNPAIALGLIFLNPLFFTVMLAATKQRAGVIALLIGVPLGPVLHLISPEWGLLATGLIGGSAAFWLYQRFLRQPPGQQANSTESQGT